MQIGASLLIVYLGFKTPLGELGNKQTNIIASIPIGISDLRLNVHQDMQAIKAQVNRYIRKITPLSNHCSYIDICYWLFCG